ncbi:hypothetical protein BGZ91_012351, partial [Linnemannia elongata]
MDVPASECHRRGPQIVLDEHKNDSSNTATERGHQSKTATKNMLNPQDYEAAANMGLMKTMACADQGDVQAQWLVRAAENGHAEAQYNMGSAYEKGQGVPQSNTRSFEWYLKSADQGLAEAQAR